MSTVYLDILSFGSGHCRRPCGLILRQTNPLTRLTRFFHRLSIRLQSQEYKSYSLTCQWSQFWFLSGAFNSLTTSDFECYWSLSVSFLAPRASKGKLEACEEARASGDTCSGKHLQVEYAWRIFAVAGCISAKSTPN